MIFLETKFTSSSALLQPPQLQHICQALIISRILYAVSAWGGFLSAELKNRINGFFRRLYRYGYTPALVDMEQLLHNADETLLCKALKDVHCLHHDFGRRCGCQSRFTAL